MICAIVMSNPNYVYFDLETQKSAAEVGGWHNKRAMKMALGVTFSTHRGTYEIYREEEVPALLQELQRADVVIGYNVVDFDFEVLAPYSVFDLSQVPVLDLMRDVEKTIGSRIGLDAISEQTLGCGKTADGMESLKWWKEGKLKPIAEYCCYDVKATRLVHEFGLEYGCVFYFSKKTQRREKVVVNW
jgi:DEAD/DEAH box helicase domain-containing protein